MQLAPRWQMWYDDSLQVICIVTVHCLHLLRECKPDTKKLTNDAAVDPFRVTPSTRNGPGKKALRRGREMDINVPAKLLFWLDSTKLLLRSESPSRSVVRQGPGVIYWSSSSWDRTEFKRSERLNESFRVSWRCVRIVSLPNGNLFDIWSIFISYILPVRRANHFACFFFI